MAPSSLKKMSGSKGRKEGNYASLDESTSLDVFTSDNLGLTLLPRPQIQKKDVGEKAQAAIGRPTTICTTEQQGDSQRCPLELEEQCHPVTRRSTVDESIGGSCYFGLSKRVERYSNTGSYDDEAVLRPDDCCSGIQGNHDLKRKDFSLSTETISMGIGNGLHHDRKANTKHSRVPYHSSLTKKGRQIERDILYNSSNQMLKEEMRKIGCNGASDSLDSVLGNEHDCGRYGDITKACENSLKHKSCGSKGKKSEDLLLTSASGNIGGLTFTKPIKDNRLSKDYPLILPIESAQRPYRSTRTSESENTVSVIPETNNHSRIASALLAPVELQGSSKAIPTAHQQALNSLQLSPQLILKPSQAPRNFHAAPPKKASKSVEHLKRSWTRHFPTRTKNLPSKGQDSDHAHTSSATPSCSIASKTHSNPLKTCFARENSYKIVTHLNSRILASSPPCLIEISSRASFKLEREISNNVGDTGIVQNRSKAGIKRSNSLPDLRLLHRSSNMYPQHAHQPYQFPTPPREHHAFGDYPQNSGPNYTSLPTNHAAQSMPRNIHGNINTPPTGITYQQMNANTFQPGQSLATPDMEAPINGYPQVFNIHAPSQQTLINYPVSTNDGLIYSNGDRFYTTAEYTALNEKYDNLGRRLQNHEETLHRARELNQMSEARIRELERMIEGLKQQLKSETTKNAKPPKNGVKTKSSGNRGVARTVDWVRNYYPTPGQQSLNARSASSENTSIPLTNGNDGPSLESGATINTMVSPTQRQYAAVPALATGYPSAQADHVQAPFPGSFQLGDPFLSGPYNPPIPTHPPIPNYPSIPTCSPDPSYPPDPYSFGQYSSHETQPGHPLQNQGNQFQQTPGDQSVVYYQQSPQLSVSRTPPATVQAEASTSGIKRKRETEPDAAQGVKRQQQPMETQPGLPPEQAANDDQAPNEALRKMQQKRYKWYDGVLPFRQTSKEGKQFGLPSASLPQATTHPALTLQAPKGLIAPTTGKAPRKTTQKTPTMRKVPKTDLEKKAIRAQYNKTYKAKKKANERIEKNKAAANLEASETTLPLSNANNDADLLPGRPVDSAQEEDDDVNSQSSDSVDDDDSDEASQTNQPHGATEETDDTNNPNPDGLSLADQALAAELEAAMMEMEEDEDPTAQAVEDATAETINEIIDEESEESEEE